MKLDFLGYLYFILGGFLSLFFIGWIIFNYNQSIMFAFIGGVVVAKTFNDFLELILILDGGKKK
ncbi:unnamed protein product [marine sediment metagenome]|uniref:Uncharacterized protein n=1 Tax=marine sediment metagenome TaxID=412755 RepID=X1RDM9_9ZZZZ